MENSQRDALLSFINDELYPYALQMTECDIQDAKDLVQETCLKVLVNYENYYAKMPAGDSRAVVRVSMKNLFIDSKRIRNYRPRIVTDKVDLKISTADDQDRIKKLMLLEKNEQMLRDYIYTSSDECLIVLGLFLSGKKCREIARMMNISVNTVTGRIRYAKRKVRKNIIPMNF